VLMGMELERKLLHDVEQRLGGRIVWTLVRWWLRGHS